jgi:hypothetical protein
MVKRAYGVETLEHLFSECELLDACAAAGLRLRTQVAVEGDSASNRHCITYVFDKPPRLVRRRHEEAAP